jgi:pyruvate dehydrogenase E2 component (dihydrolipoamide acetyltransferase)
MPALSPTMEEGKLARWLVHEGDTVKSGDVIAEIETDKATMEVEAVDEGRVSKILVPEGTEGVKVNAPIAELVGEGETAAPSQATAPSPRPSPQAKIGEGANKTPAPQPKFNGAAGDRIIASPLAKRIAKEKAIELAAVQGSGPHGRIVLADVENLTGGKPKPAQARSEAPRAPQPTAPGALPDPRLYFEKGSYTEVPHDAMRKAIARRLTQSMQLTPHYYLTLDCEIDELMRARKLLNAQSPDKAGPYKLSVNDFIVRAVALALIKFPPVNVSWADDAMLLHNHADIGVAVAIDGGLITPIVRNAETKGLVAISREVASLAEKARTKKLKPTDYEGGSFAISNLGMYGIKSFTAVINPPHAAILAVGKGEERAIVKDGAIVKATVMTLTMSCDHRAVDGATGAQFLEILKLYIENPLSMLL